ncbi:hypothetical protein [Corallococcus sp. Z5C101001]|uniref:hypothetical protein n=1 Tax=Corallococcus sp. Z5C101001 TaxID=2596829 RepID=UPI00117BEDDE|nr:hypothetical protein [Corallococcus sp. Z5C101001]TSC23948.1 hypothetical protein FOF48_27480 [Corallococcus sp. Z5C101001]
MMFGRGEEEEEEEEAGELMDGLNASPSDVLSGVGGRGTGDALGGRVEDDDAAGGFICAGGFVEVDAELDELAVLGTVGAAGGVVLGVRENAALMLFMEWALLKGENAEQPYPGSG